MYTNDEILAKAKELGKMMAETEAVEFFKRAEAQIHETQVVREKMASLKSLQKQAVNFEQYGKEKALGMVEEKIAKVEAELDEMPIVDQFKEAQFEVNSLLQMVSHAISQTVTDEIIISTGGDLLTGETGAEKANAAPGCGN
ncbi:RicAFT regulatory complex protein RicA family protein [Macrococcus armenti]|uniref:RicAFT regulatory complex protein RicA family protein n=1 Tax=Macrococcus armenti TaxID=2875764 RepID=A0ABY3ZX13_9STAP|nr:RicAFT regulatory complex protein RicA family protein [Macrococcus armenti]UBH09598.1 RicAFT regulatory complex protein RicA family protein [Macrococcus armenti]UBH11873.1 RicAFT regulatory complex protein RicA family protein [Macrococcus armenti]UBH14090.1 RicAFT regulatory complex protein RicA family protein [Macrococcus armenti]UBH16349.1 RicAFT regulatory complex protein RicA family protein [Macrococcus armenti]UBH18705.1 RicAFT regulatory complex protein RicA family protein [Macrococcu